VPLKHCIEAAASPREMPHYKRDTIAGLRGFTAVLTQHFMVLILQLVHCACVHTMTVEV